MPIGEEEYYPEGLEDNAIFNSNLNSDAGNFYPPGYPTQQPP
jgi:hypothetical protein